MGCEYMNTRPKICPECRFTNQSTSIECIDCGFSFDKEDVRAYQELAISDQFSQPKESAPTAPKFFWGTRPLEPASKGPPIICPECRFANKSTTANCSNCGFIFPAEKSVETITTPPTTEILSEEKKSLFSSLHYRVQDLVFEGPIVRLIPYTGSIQEITAKINQNQIIMSGCIKHQTNPTVNLELKTNKELLPPSNDDCWQNITLTGDETIINEIKQRREIAEQMVSIGTTFIRVESQTTGEIYIRLICNENKEAVTQTYSLITELQSFIEEL